ncbi:hypothetical protein GCM10010452_11370 [Crossiella cryophila]
MLAELDGVLAVVDGVLAVVDGVLADGCTSSANTAYDNGQHTGEVRAGMPGAPRSGDQLAKQSGTVMCLWQRTVRLVEPVWLRLSVTVRVTV